MKKLLFLVGALFLSLGLIACDDNAQTYTYEEVLETIEIGFAETDSMSNVTEDLTLPFLSSLDKNAKLSWESSHEEIISSAGVVTRPLYDTEVTLILSLRVGSISRQEFFILTVKGTIQYYTVTFNIEDVETSQTIEDGQLVSEPTEVPAKANHVFTGWFLEDTLYNFSTPVTGDLTLVAGFELIQNAQYVIEFYEERIENDTYQRLSNEVLVGTPGETITLNRSKEGFVINTELSILSGVVTTETPLILKVYFDRIVYDVTFTVDGDVIEQSGVKYQDVVTLIDAPIVEMYDFIGWYIDQELTTPFEETSLVTEDITLYAKYEEVTEGEYQVVIYEENLNDNLYTQKSQTSYTVEFGTFVTFSQPKDGFEINESISTLEGTVEFGEELVLEVYYDRMRYDVQFIDDTVVYETTVKYNGVVTQIEDLTKEGYEFVGWTRTQNGTNEYDFSLRVDSDVILYAIWNDLNAPVYEGYYASLNGLMDYEIKTQLTQIITPMNDRGYDTAITILQNSDKDPNNANNLILVYDRISRVSTWSSGVNGTWNREHVWPQSKLGTASDSDVHNLKPADPQTNSTRSNTIFADGSGAAGNVSGGWYPGDEDRGDIARIVLYMNVRWGLIINTSSIGNLNTFLQWHIEDPVDDFESNRNDVIYTWQQNRNPFIDHPELVERIWGPITLSNGDSVSLDFYSEELFTKINIDTYDLPVSKRSNFLFA